MLFAYNEGRLWPAIRWYAHYHITHCTRCREALAALIALRDRLRRLVQTSTDPLPTLTPDRRAAVEAAMQTIDRPMSPTDASSSH